MKETKLVKKAKGMKVIVEGGTPQKKALRTHDRNSVIIPQMVGSKIGIHNGNSFQVVDIQPEMLGHVLGEYALTRKRIMHGKAGIGATKSSTAINARG